MQVLLKQGMRVIERNWRNRHKELDIIALDGDCIVFVEVKTRSSEIIHVSDVLSDIKMKNVISAASSYMRKKNINLECRFDVVLLTGNAGRYEIEHIENAFRAYSR